ncbi:hypothetical protein INR49_028613 [Caranx melampygus]|nr:hypothetical protein INR49_028613 [Caranx melampygus]
MERHFVQSERSGHAVGGSRAAPERDVEIVEERRLVGHECHSLRVPYNLERCMQRTARSPFQVMDERQRLHRGGLTSTS